MNQGSDISMKLTDIDEETKLITPFRPKLLTGGKGPTGYADWLSEMKTGSVFLVKNLQQKSFVLGQFHLLHKLERAIHLMNNMDQGQEVHMWVDPLEFCQQFGFVEILMEPEDEDDQLNT